MVLKRPAAYKNEPRGTFRLNSIIGELSVSA